MKKPKINITEATEKIGNVRWTAFIVHDKDPYICHRFTIALEKLMPYKLTQIKPVMMEDGATTADRMIIETTPKGVRERYIIPAMMDNFISNENLQKIRELASMYCRYLDSNQEDRLRYYTQDEAGWSYFI